MSIIHRVRCVKETFDCPDHDLSAKNDFASVYLCQLLPGAGESQHLPCESTFCCRMYSDTSPPCFHCSVSFYQFSSHLSEHSWKVQISFPCSEPNRHTTKFNWIINRQSFGSFMTDPSTSEETSVHLPYLWQRQHRPAPLFSPDEQCLVWGCRGCSTPLPCIWQNIFFVPP